MHEVNYVNQYAGLAIPSYSKPLKAYVFLVAFENDASICIELLVDEMLIYTIDRMQK